MLVRKQNLENSRIIERIVIEIDNIIESGVPVIVEGKKDRASLLKLGITSIIVLDKALYAVIESIDSKEVVLLTDLDPEGRKLYHKLKSWLVPRGVKIDDNLRQLLFKAKTSHVEGLHRIVKKWKSQKG